MIYSFLTSLYYYPGKLIVFITNLLYFRKIRVVGLKNIPKKGPVIYAITHQNSLLDAYLSNGFSWRSPYYMVRADMFSNKIVGKIMRSIKTLPVYRIRDGYNSVKNNDDTFERTKEILIKGGVVAIFPEGSHSLTHKVRPLKKGIARIAFMAEAAENFNLDIKIVPFGINYEDYFSSSSRTLVNIGKPLSIGQYKKDFLEDENLAYRNMTTDLRNRMKSLIVHISSTDYDGVYEEYKKQRVYKLNLMEQLKSDQQLIHCIENDEKFEDTADKRNIIIHFIREFLYRIRLIISFIPKKIVEVLAKKMVKDKHFVATMKFTFTYILYPIFFVIVFYIAKLILKF